MHGTLARSDDLRLVKFVHLMRPVQHMRAGPIQPHAFPNLLRGNKVNKVRASRTMRVSFSLKYLLSDI